MSLMMLYIRKINTKSANYCSMFVMQYKFDIDIINDVIFELKFGSYYV